jgi:hypothetical protein
MIDVSKTNVNRVYISGIVSCAPVFSHATFDETFYSFKLAVNRLSGAQDILPVIITKNMLDKIWVGVHIGIIGQLRSYNIFRDNVNKLMLTVFTKKVISDIIEDENKNEICLCGYICKKPIYRITPFKREISDILLAVNRAYKKSDYLPLIVWGKNAFIVKDYIVGQKINIKGRIQSREYNKALSNGEVLTKTAYEVSVAFVEKI